MGAIVDFCQAPQQLTDDTNQGCNPQWVRNGYMQVQSPHDRKAAAIKNDVNCAYAKEHLIENKENIGARAFEEESRAGFRVGDWLEVFSNTCQVWCAAQVSKVPAPKMVTVDFRTPGAVEPSHKTLPMGSKELRKDVRHSH